METSKIAAILIIVLIIAIILSIVKSAVKFIILVLTAVLLFTVVRTVILGKNPLDLFNNTKAAAAYTKQIYDYSGKISNSLNGTIKAMENNSFNQLKDENGIVKSIDEIRTKLNKYINDLTQLRLNQKF